MLCILQQSLQKSHFCLTEANFGLSPTRNHVFFGLFVREAFCNTSFFFFNLFVFPLFFHFLHNAHNEHAGQREQRRCQHRGFKTELFRR